MQKKQTINCKSSSKILLLVIKYYLYDRKYKFKD